MRGAELYDRVINSPGLPDLTIAFGVSVALIMLAALLLSDRSAQGSREGAWACWGLLAIMVSLVRHPRADHQAEGRRVCHGHALSLSRGHPIPDPGRAARAAGRGRDR